MPNNIKAGNIFIDFTIKTSLEFDYFVLSYCELIIVLLFHLIMNKLF